MSKEWPEPENRRWTNDAMTKTLRKGRENKDR